jgi:hypothetical protein
MGNLSGDLEKRLAKLGIKKQVEASMVVEEAQKKIEQVFGERGKQNLRVISFKNNTLKIAATNNLWATECQGKISQVVKKDTKVRYQVLNSLETDFI